MMAKPMETLELHYPMIQFLINSFNQSRKTLGSLLQYCSIKIITSIPKW